MSVDAEYPTIPPGWCAFHDEIEEVIDGQPWCFECWHRWPDVAALLADHNRVLTEMGVDRQETDPAEVFCCPFCVHDL